MTRQIELLNQTKNSNNTQSADANDHIMFVSYQTIGVNDEKASISLFEYDEIKGCIKPLNFMIVTQKINKVTKLFNDIDYRTLSAVAEDPAENEVGSFSLK